MRVLVAIDLNDADLDEAYGASRTLTPDVWSDVRASLDARLTEAGYFGDMSYPVRGAVTTAAVVEDLLPILLDCAEVGVEGYPDDADDADAVFEVIRSLRQGADA